MPFIENGGVRIHYEVEGEGPPLFLHHGAGESLETWRSLGYTKAFGRHLRLVLMDTRGHGQSDKPEDAAAYEMPALTGDVVAVLDAAGVDRCHFLGYSLGGRVGFGMAKYAPERLLSVSVGGSHPYAAEPEAARIEIDLLQRRLAAAQGLRTGASPTRSLLAASLATARDPGYADILEQIEVACLLFIGERDGNYDGAAACAEALRDVDFLVFPGLDHGETIRRSDLVAPEVIRFLAGLS